MRIWATDIDSGIMNYVDVPDEVKLGCPLGPSQEECDFLCEIYRSEKERLGEDYD